MSTSYKVVGVRYPTHMDLAADRKVVPVVIEVATEAGIKPAIETLLFNSDKSARCNNALVKWKGKLYLCDGANPTKKTFVKIEIPKHPLEKLT